MGMFSIDERCYNYMLFDTKQEWEDYLYTHPEIIRCKDCKFNKKYGNDFSPRWCIEMRDDDFCSYAERL